MKTKKIDLKKMKLNFDLYFNLCQRAEIVQVGLNMSLCDDIGDASSSLRGSTSSSNNNNDNYYEDTALSFSLAFSGYLTSSTLIYTL